MADPVKETAGSAGSFLTRKLGPLPVWAWMAIAGGVYFYISRRQKASAAAGANQQTDPAGNVGSINPATGYVYGSPEDQAALAAQNPGSASPSGSAGQGATSGGQKYADNNSWGIAAVSYLDGIGVDPTTASQAVQQYLSSQALTAAQQGDVNLAILQLGPPPSLPGPVATNPPPVTTPGSGTTGTTTGTPPPKGKTAPPPTGLTVTAKHSTSATVKWNRATGATGYMVKATDLGTKRVVEDSGTKALMAVIGGLTPSHTYEVWVFSQPGDTPTGPHASVTFTCPKTG